jgi:uncharacterized LabA/DUF88 family protein
MHREKDIKFGIFWDYENVPLRKDDYYEIFLGLKAFIEQHEIRYAKVYYRESTITQEDIKIIRDLKVFQFKQIKHNHKNAVDKTLIQSCLSIIKQYPEINQLLLISGDADFLPLLQNLFKQGIKVSILCQEGNKNRKFLEKASKVAFLSDLIHHPQSWWEISQDVREDPYASEELPEGVYLYEDGGGELEKYDLASEPFKEDD